MTAEIPNITLQEIRGSLLAIPAFVPAMVCTGYLTAWATNLHNFRQRSLVERLFWSLPLSLGVSTIGAYWIGRFLSLDAVVPVFAASALACVALLAWEWRERRRLNQPWVIGFRPLGSTALALAVLWVAVAILSLVDWQNGDKLYISTVAYDQSARVDWTYAVLNTGVPPFNPLYLYKNPAPMRSYYFWYIICAATARLTFLSIRAIFIASCVWSGFCLAAIAGLYLKYFLDCGNRLRRQFITTVLLLLVTGLDILAALWELLSLQRPFSPDLEHWSLSQITSWLDSLLWVPHHIASLVTCMLAFLLVWISEEDVRPVKLPLILAGCVSASAFGISIYVTFAFFLTIVAWTIWQVRYEHSLRKAYVFLTVCAVATFLILPYLLELTHAKSQMDGGGVFTLAVREMIPPDKLLAWPILRRIAADSPATARTFANLVLLIPGYILELGFYLLALLIYTKAKWRGRAPFTHAHRTLIFLTLVAITFLSVIRSSVLSSNDFGWRGALIMQFTLLLLGSELITHWRDTTRGLSITVQRQIASITPEWMRSGASLLIFVGLVSTTCQIFLLRTYLPLLEMQETRLHDIAFEHLAHYSYINHVGFSEIDGKIDRGATLQFNPSPLNPYIANTDLLGVHRQVAIAGDKPWCGAELGGDPSGCQPMASAIDALFKDASAEEARQTCRQIGIQYLVARVYDPVWTDKNSWVWNLKPVVQDEEFRALDCR